MPIVTHEVIQSRSLSMLHDIENTIANITLIKDAFSSRICNHVQTMASLDNDSIEYKQLEAQRQQLAAYEKKLDAQLQELQNRKQKAMTELQKAGQDLQQGIAMMYGGGGHK